jgi:beta-xylosidase
MSFRFGYIFVLLSIILLASCNQNKDSSATQKNAQTGYLFSYFMDNGQDGLHLAWSRDALNWNALNGGESLLIPEVGISRLMRDPCVVQGPDGTFHMVWTDSWYSKTIGYASTKDFIHWSEQKSIPVMADEPTAVNCWAPEITYDDEIDQFIIFWATTIPGKFTETWFDGKNHNNHRIYSITTKDFESFTPTKLFFDPGFNCIDSTLLQLQGKFYMCFKNETLIPQPMKNLRLAEADSLMGPYTVLPLNITAPDSWVEGPTMLHIDDYTYLYFDAYADHHYAAMRSKDMEHWEDITSQLKMPQGIRHGTAFKAPMELIEKLKKTIP